MAPSVVVGCYERFLFGFNSDAKEGKLTKEATYAAHKGPVCCIEAAGNFLVSGGNDDTIHVYNLMSGVDLGFLVNPVDGAVPCLSFVCPRNSQKPTHLLSGALDGGISMWNAGGQWSHLHRLTGHKGPVNSIAVHCDGKLAFSTSRDSHLCLWDLVRGKKLFRGKLASEAISVKFHPDDESYLVSSTTAVHKLSLETGAQQAVWNNDQKILSVCAMENGLVGTGSEKGVVKLWDSRVKAKPCVEIIEAHKSRVKGVDAVQENGRQFMATGGSDGVVKLWDLRYGTNGSLASKVLCEESTKARITCLKTVNINKSEKRERNKPDRGGVKDASENGIEDEEMMDATPAKISSTENGTNSDSELTPMENSVTPPQSDSAASKLLGNKKRLLSSSKKQSAKKKKKRKLAAGEVGNGMAGLNGLGNGIDVTGEVGEKSLEAKNKKKKKSVRFRDDENLVEILGPKDGGVAENGGGNYNGDVEVEHQGGSVKSSGKKKGRRLNRVRVKRRVKRR